MPMMGFRFHEPDKTGRSSHLMSEGGRARASSVSTTTSRLTARRITPIWTSAVQAIFDAKWGGKGIYKEEGGPAPLKDRQSLDKLVNKTPDWCLDASKALCRSTSGRRTGASPRRSIRWR